MLLSVPILLPQLLLLLSLVLLWVLYKVLLQLQLYFLSLQLASEISHLSFLERLGLTSLLQQCLCSLHLIWL